MFEKEPGCLKLFSLYGIPVFFHWSFPISGILISLYAKADIGEVFYFILSCSILIFLHELGHLLAAKHLELKVHALKISGAGGMCYSEVPKDIGPAFLLYSGGLIAQALLFVIAATYLSLFSYPDSNLGFCLIITFTLVNVIMFVINIIPSKNQGGQITDGYVLWKLFWEWRRQA